MSDKRMCFLVRVGDSGDRLIWRFPFHSPETRQALTPRWKAEQAKALAQGAPPLVEPQSITVGYYIQLDDPPGAWAFMPSLTPYTPVVLEMPVVQRRIARDLIIRLEEQNKNTS